MSFTIVPLHNLDRPEGSRIPFGKKFAIQDVPTGLEKDKTTLSEIARAVLARMNKCSRERSTSRRARVERPASNVPLKCFRRLLIYRGP